MSAKQSDLALTFFNETVRQFFDDLKMLYPDDKVLKMALAGILLYMRTSPTGVLESFKVVLGPYFPKILLKDESFFLEHTAAEYKLDYKRMTRNPKLMQDLLEVKEQYGQVRDENVSMFDKVIDKLKGEWKGMKPQNKNVIWDYVTQLVHFSNRVTAAAV